MVLRLRDELRALAAGDAGALLVGSDDGVLAYLNGQEVHRNDCQRAYTADLDEISVSLKAGWNTLVFRVTQAEAWRGRSAPASRPPATSRCR